MQALLSSNPYPDLHEEQLITPVEEERVQTPQLEIPQESHVMLVATLKP